MEDTDIAIEINDGPAVRHDATCEDQECEIVLSASGGLTTHATSAETYPTVIPLQISGGVDTSLTSLTSEELEAQAIRNMWQDGDEWGYLVRHGGQPLTDFGRDQQGNTRDNNIFEQAFAALYPYGTGGIESDLCQTLDFQKHVQWSLQYCDHRFRKHPTFAFLAFGILQRRQALLSARIQMHRRDFDKHARILTGIDVSRLKQAAVEESKQQPLSDPAIRLLKKHVYTSIGKVMGSNQARYQLRSQIWSTAIRKGPPSLWITINPSDLNDPIVQVFAGENIDLDQFVATQGPGKEQRAQNVAEDPFAAAKFFHFMINAILQHLLQVKVTEYQVHSHMGVLGRVAAYFATVESQGRGTLHLHMLLWLLFTPSADEIQVMLGAEDFRDRVKQYIRANIRAYLPGLESATTIKAIPKNNEVAYCRPVPTDVKDHDARRQDLELQLARMEQVHTCRLNRCLFPDRDGVITCKRKAPFRLSDDDVVHENGDWACKRLYGYVNGWNPAILVNGRCNNDIKLLTNGADTRNISFYVTAYAAKKQGKSYNLSAIMERTYAYHQNNLTGEFVIDHRHRHRLFLIRVMQAVLREQEIAAPLVMSYLMGWGDVLRSHQYTPVYWSTFVRALRSSFNEFNERSP